MKSARYRTLFSVVNPNIGSASYRPATYNISSRNKSLLGLSVNSNVKPAVSSFASHSSLMINLHFMELQDLIRRLTTRANSQQELYGDTLSFWYLAARPID